MLARSGRLPTSGDYAYELKWDGFRAIVSTEGPLRVRSRRGWDMTPHVGFLVDLPVRAVLDGELVAFDADGKPDFPQLCGCVLMRRTTAPPLTFVAFDVLSVEGRNVMGLPHTKRREILDGLGLNGQSPVTGPANPHGYAAFRGISRDQGGRHPRKAGTPALRSRRDPLRSQRDRPPQLRHAVTSRPFRNALRGTPFVTR
jgi:bifunctional non-homologous end joining protein LigD